MGGGWWWWLVTDCSPRVASLGAEAQLGRHRELPHIAGLHLDDGLLDRRQHLAAANAEVVSLGVCHDVVDHLRGHNTSGNSDAARSNGESPADPDAKNEVMNMHELHTCPVCLTTDLKRITIRSPTTGLPPPLPLLVTEYVKPPPRSSARAGLPKADQASIAPLPASTLRRVGTAGCGGSAFVGSERPDDAEKSMHSAIMLFCEEEKEPCVGGDDGDGDFDENKHNISFPLP